MSNKYIPERALQLFLIIVFTLFAFPANCQDKADTLHEVIIKSNAVMPANDERINTFSPGQKVKTIDSLTLQQYKLQSIANLLAQQTSVFVKTYSFNGLATLNFRGASAAQSQVYWNGVPIQNAALGIADVSTLPVILMNKINIVYGGSAALWGSGNVGGAVLIENKLPEFDGKKEGSVVLGAGSYGQLLGGLKANINTKKIFLSLNAFCQKAQNDFLFHDTYGDKRYTANDGLNSIAAILQSSYKIAQNNTLNFTGWYQAYNREIPAALFETYSIKRQQDKSLRLLLDWQKQTDNNRWFAKASLIRDYMHYTDSAILLNANNTVYQYYQEIGWSKKINENNRFLIFMPVQVAWININPGDSVKSQAKTAIAAAYEISAFKYRLNIAVNLREETANNNFYFLPGSDAAFRLNRWFSLKADLQRTYRVPTLNELYYNPGGNVNLKPEQGWSEDGGFVVKIKTGNFNIYQETSVFNRMINDWIIWLGGAIWTPHNIETVHSRGVETDNLLEWKLNKWKFHIRGNTSYILATTTNSYITNDGSIGKQIPYSPRYSAQINAGCIYKNLYFNYNHTYVGYRFITADESEYLAPYQTDNLQITYTIPLKKNILQFSGQCNNIANNEYQIVAGRPMPGINWLMSVNFSI